MLIVHTRLRNVKYVNESKEWANSEASAPAFICHRRVHAHVEILKNQLFSGLRRWKLCKLSCSDFQ